MPVTGRSRFINFAPRRNRDDCEILPSTKFRKRNARNHRPRALLFVLKCDKSLVLPWAMSKIGLLPICFARLQRFVMRHSEKVEARNQPQNFRGIFPVRRIRGWSADIGHQLRFPLRTGRLDEFLMLARFQKSRPPEMLYN